MIHPSSGWRWCKMIYIDGYDWNDETWKSKRIAASFFCPKWKRVREAEWVRHTKAAKFQIQIQRHLHKHLRRNIETYLKKGKLKLNLLKRPTMKVRKINHLWFSLFRIRILLRCGLRFAREKLLRHRRKTFNSMDTMKRANRRVRPYLTLNRLDEASQFLQALSWQAQIFSSAS